jgi:hypothetical protein
VFKDPRTISVAMLWQMYEARLLHPNTPAANRDALREAFYMGFTECFKIHFDMSTELTEDQAVEVLGALNAECHEFFEAMAKKHGLRPQL